MGQARDKTRATGPGLDMTLKSIEHLNDLKGGQNPITGTRVAIGHFGPAVRCRQYLTLINIITSRFSATKNPGFKISIMVEDIKR